MDTKFRLRFIVSTGMCEGESVVDSDILIMKILASTVILIQFYGFSTSIYAKESLLCLVLSVMCRFISYFICFLICVEKAQSSQAPPGSNSDVLYVFLALALKLFTHFFSVNILSLIQLSRKRETGDSFSFELAYFKNVFTYSIAYAFTCAFSLPSLFLWKWIFFTQH